MECLHPIKIVNPSKYVSLKYKDRFVQYVRCGKCANCQKTLQNEWYYRTLQECHQCISHGGYVLFDGLSYAPGHVPRLSDFFADLPCELDYMCFNYQHIKDFLKRLRRDLEYRGYNVAENLRYFCSTEYGTDDRFTHRPHIHILFYCTIPDLSPLDLSALIAKHWKYGRTDGLPYKSSQYVLHNSFRSHNYQRASKYVAKYVMKDSSFQKTIDRRLYQILHWKYNKYFYSIGLDFDKWLVSHQGKKVQKECRYYINQFHLQSLHYGESAMSQFNVDDLIENNMIKVLDSKSIVMRLGLPMYYKRKLFYDRKKVNGCYSWIPNELGKKYLAKRELDMLVRFRDLYTTLGQYGIKVDNPLKLADYVVNKRGRIKFGDSVSTIEDRMRDDECQYLYICPTDKEHFGFSFVSRNYLGNCKKYDVQYVDSCIPISNFIACNVYFDSDYERVLDRLCNTLFEKGKLKQADFDNQQRLKTLYKALQMV